VTGTIDWLLDGAPGAPRATDVLDQLCRRLRAEGVPVDRAALFVQVLHPQFMGMSAHWLPDQPIAIEPAHYALAAEDSYLNSPATLVMTSGTSMRRDLGAPAGSEEMTILRQLRAEGYTDYLIQPLRFSQGDLHAVSWATRRAGGFGDGDLAWLAAINRPLARIIEIMVLRRLGMTLLDTYVGHRSGERVLRGAIRPGDVERIEAAILFTDLRGFTAFSNSHAPEQVIERVNAVFGCIVPAVDAEGGEVLKLIGDGLLAIFPIGDAPPGAVGAAALRAATTAIQALANLALEPPPRCGMSLHLGEVSYGNIGAGSRLDFTAIGPAVNLTARLEPLTSALQRPLVVSAAFAATVDAELEPLGSFPLRGFAEPVPVYGLAA
jgi:adenylate cyclase